MDELPDRRTPATTNCELPQRRATSNAELPQRRTASTQNNLTQNCNGIDAKSPRRQAVCPRSHARCRTTLRHGFGNSNAERGCTTRRHGFGNGNAGRGCTTRRHGFGNTKCKRSSPIDQRHMTQSIASAMRTPHILGFLASWRLGVKQFSSSASMPFCVHAVLRPAVLRPAVLR
jgi:hypothetical protein